jgi:glycerophosphoryl diester phosphodiesterase
MVAVVAHRGLRYEKPENTIPSIEAALQLPGLHGVEFDVELSGDGQLVVLHQETLVADPHFRKLELAKRDYVSRDWVHAKTAKEVTSLDAGTWMGSQYADIKVPSLSDVLALPWRDVTAYVELKDATFWGVRDPARAEGVVRAFLPYLKNHSGKVAAISFNPEILRELKRNAPEIRTVLALWTEWDGREQEAIEQAKACSACVISLPYSMILKSPLWIDLSHAMGLEIHAYPVSPAFNEPEFANWTPQSQQETWRSLTAFGIDGLLSDFARESIGQFS